MKKTHSVRTLPVGVEFFAFDFHFFYLFSDLLRRTQKGASLSLEASECLEKARDWLSRLFTCISCDSRAAALKLRVCTETVFSWARTGSNISSLCFSPLRLRRLRCASCCSTLKLAWRSSSASEALLRREQRLRRS